MSSATTSAPPVLPTTRAPLYHPLAPRRVFDSRKTTAMRPGEDLRLRFDFGARNPVVRGVALNVTVTGARKPGYLRVWNGWSTPIVSSVLNYRVGGSVANMVVTSTEVNYELGTPTTGWPSIGIANGSSGKAHLVVDVVGVWTDQSVPGHRFAAMAPTRVLDTRTGTGTYAGRIGPARSRRVRPHVPGATGDVAAVLATMTTIRPTRSTYLTVWDGTTSRPTVSTTNVPAGRTRASSVFVARADDGGFRIYNAAGWTDLALDASGVLHSRVDDPTPVPVPLVSVVAARP